ncbi:LacI family DNA-binding transcriptional regulator [Coraliomargarita sp. SDUM461004]|uniref:LacI family DNA-binding transcriptional regulator n=1 Tax=Thalassobacterium sedimentorum TaxID=3041258 RepID=A0ABU1AGQ7_9BACT|nr:LacI family DNA-binding transcriptional regulator [Coraliomargarita sp. SDUM461004]MDQ8193774.1 LacI family DNA-binding transcriptional regulator [Coraliomargarita sp. SDUM461004]
MAKLNLDVIAKKAGVSIATVSRALNGLPGVSESRVAQIQQIVDEMGERPKLRGRNQVKVKTAVSLGVYYNTVAIIVAGDGFLHASEVFLKQVHPICQRFAEEGIAVLISTDGMSVQKLPQSIRDREIDGVFYFGNVSAEVCGHLSGVTSLWMTSRREHGKPFLLAGNRRAGVISAEYLAEHSYKKVFIINPDREADALVARGGACEARARELELEVGIHSSSRLAPDSGREAWAHLWDEIVADVLAADALFIPADWLTASLYPFLIANGFFDRPNVTVISCGGYTSYLRGLHPAPVTVDFGYDVVGRVAADQLLWKIRNPQISREISVVINPVIISSDG